ncbi:MAG: hypothetical protein F6K57_23890 [Moorea sp. SIO4A5]|nr:hypothetical protein [Moorena sp. SIO4A5]
MGSWGDGEMGNMFIAFIILTRYSKLLSYPDSRLPTPDSRLPTPDSRSPIAAFNNTSAPNRTASVQGKPVSVCTCSMADRAA